MSGWYQCRDTGCFLRVKAIPGARRSAIVGLLGDRLKIRVAAPPEGGRANDAIRVILAEAVPCRLGEVRLVSGARAPEKIFQVPKTTPARLDALAGV